MKRPATAVLFTVAVAGFAAAVAPRAMQIESLKARSQRLEKELVEVRVNNAKLEQELRLLRDDPVYLEKVARDKFNKAKEGEIVYKVVRAGEDTRKQR
jgi:cell division protein DivIC